MHQHRSDNEAHRAQGMARQYQEEYASEEEEDSLQAGPPPGKHTLTESLQRLGDGIQGSQDPGVQAEGRGEEAHTIAEEGLRGSGQPLPYMQQIQRSFGRHELGAVQAQDYLGALWAVGLRMRGATEAHIEQALAVRTIVRTWPMRGTLHFVAPADVRWMLELLTPRVVARSAGRHRELELDDAVFGRSQELLVRALSGGRQLTRDALS